MIWPIYNYKCSTPFPPRFSKHTQPEMGATPIVGQTSQGQSGRLLDGCHIVQQQRPLQKRTEQNSPARWFKVPFSSPSWRSLNPLKGSLKPSQKGHFESPGECFWAGKWDDCLLPFYFEMGWSNKIGRVKIINCFLIDFCWVICLPGFCCGGACQKTCFMVTWALKSRKLQGWKSSLLRSFLVGSVCVLCFNCFEEKLQKVHAKSQFRKKL